VKVSTPNLLRTPISGISPEKKLVDKFKERNRVNRLIEEGIAPLSVLLDRSNIVRNVRLPKSGGIPPWRKFALKYLKACLTRYIFMAQH
jgi:hypothetical protein